MQNKQPLLPASCPSAKGNSLFLMCTVSLRVLPRCEPVRPVFGGQVADFQLDPAAAPQFGIQQEASDCNEGEILSYYELGNICNFVKGMISIT